MESFQAVSEKTLLDLKKDGAQASWRYIYSMYSLNKLYSKLDSLSVCEAASLSFLLLSENQSAETQSEGLKIASALYISDHHIGTLELARYYLNQGSVNNAIPYLRRLIDLEFPAVYYILSSPLHYSDTLVDNLGIVNPFDHALRLRHFRAMKENAVSKAETSFLNLFSSKLKLKHLQFMELRFALSNPCHGRVAF